MNKPSMETLLHLLIKLGIALTLIALLATPLIVTAFFKSAFGILDDPVISTTIIGLFICAVPYTWALINLHRLSAMLVAHTPFTKTSVRAFKWISTCAFSEPLIATGVVYCLKKNFAFYEHILIIAPLSILIFLCIVVGLLCLVLSQLFEQARLIKEEIDMTV